MARQLGILLLAFTAASGLAMAVGAPNLGTAMAFGQIAFVLALTAVLVRGRS